ncbi:MAG TPA: glycosyltransferase family 2 protein [Steroidobacteraceae bacterium]|nr:glycosyltransferase family 2 protein [Steroidobacteraceae bacterium]
MKLISIITPCYNEAENVAELHARLRRVREQLPGYRFEHIFIDNASTDDTVARIKALIADDPDVRLIVNARNFGQVRSPYYALLQAAGDAVVVLASDLQDPPELIPEMVQRWEQGYRVVAGVKRTSRESRAMWLVRSLYYRIARKLADIQLLEHFTGYGLYDRQVIDVLRSLDDPYPYFRGLISEIGFEVARIPYDQSARVRGLTKNNFYTLYDLGMLGITSHSKLPIRLATMAGFALSLISFLVSLTYLVLKLLFWDRFQLGTAPLLIGIFFFSSVQIFFIGLIGEYVASIHTQVMRRPLVVERERVNFDGPPIATGSAARFQRSAD